jgi:DNA-binding transcriptional LysR family regulator
MAKTRGENEVGRRLKFRDLQVLFAVVESGSMAEAGRQLGLTQPAVSEVIAQLELLFGARLFDRNTRGVEPTIYGRALLKRAQAALDEVKQGVRDIAFLTDPTRGEVWIGCAQRLSAAVMPQIVERFSQTYPRIVLHIDELAPLTDDLSGLRDRKYDVMMGRPTKPLEQKPFGDDVNLEILFDDQIIVATGKESGRTKRRKIDDLAALKDARWILTSGAAEAFRLRGLSTPKVTLITSSAVVASHLLAKTDSVTVTSQFAAEIAGLNVLPIDLGLGSWPALIITLKNRTLNPVAERFIACAREVVKSIAGRSNSQLRVKTNVKTQEPRAETERRLKGD